MVRLWRQRLLLKLFSLTKLRKQCRLLVPPFLFGEANTPTLTPEAHLVRDHCEPRAPRHTSPGLVGGVQEEGCGETPACVWRRFKSS